MVIVSPSSSTSSQLSCLSDTASAVASGSTRSCHIGSSQKNTLRLAAALRSRCWGRCVTKCHLKWLKQTMGSTEKVMSFWYGDRWTADADLLFNMSLGIVDPSATLCCRRRTFEVKNACTLTRRLGLELDHLRLAYILPSCLTFIPL